MTNIPAFGTILEFYTASIFMEAFIIHNKFCSEFEGTSSWFNLGPIILRHNLTVWLIGAIVLRSEQYFAFGIVMHVTVCKFSAKTLFYEFNWYLVLSNAFSFLAHRIAF